MTDNNHPITPPEELVQQWIIEGRHQDYCSFTHYAIAKAARWGADMELDACCEVLARELIAIDLRAIRRPKPPSLKEQALAVVENSEICDHLSIEHADILRRALEQLDD